jgi:hypothetical protein
VWAVKVTANNRTAMPYPIIDWGLGLRSPKPDPRAPDLSDRPMVAIAYLLAGGLMEILGPVFWAVLIVGFLFAEFFID